MDSFPQMASEEDEWQNFVGRQDQDFFQRHQQSYHRHSIEKVARQRTYEDLDGIAAAIKDAVVFSEGVKIDWRKYPMFWRKCWDMQKSKEEREMFPVKQMQPGERVQIVHEATQFFFGIVDAMDLKEKDLLVVIGQSRTGKGTLLSALKGHRMKLFKRKKREGGVHARAVKPYFMAPVGADGQPVESDLIDHGNNSHTFVPKLVMEEARYIDEFKELDGRHIVDIPGMFESKGSEIDIAMDLTL